LPAMKGELTVFAAASLTDAFKGIGTSLEGANVGSKVTFNFAGSSTLRTQLGQGARADLFASADEANIQGAQKDGTIAGEPRVFAQNKLVIITPAQPKVVIATPQDLAKSGVKLVIGQNDLPAGNYARQILAKMDQDPAYGAGFADKVLANVVSEENNVKNVVAKVQLGEADAGIVYSTDVTAAVRPQVKIVVIPDALNVIARYPIALVKDAANPTAAQAFMDYLVSSAGQTELEKNGFIRIDTAK
jgi:molybdate transport system substrate-binding protein